MEYLISAALVSLSALFSGLTLGLFTLDTATLKRRASLGDKAAAAIYPIRKRGNLLLTTLLLGNVGVNTALSIFLGSITSGIAAGIMATAIIFLFGEIIPQAVISRHALYFGALAAPFVRVMIFIGLPITYPIAWTLDKLLGHEIPTVYSKQELMHIISEHEDSEHSAIDADEERILHGALKFSHLRVAEIMTPIDEASMVDANQIVGDDLFTFITNEGFSRYPVYDGSDINIIGILYAKDLLIEPEGIAVKETREAFEDAILRCKHDTYLDTLLTRMLKGRKHMAIVTNRNNTPLGIVTLEDIIEEIIQFEIEDEDDD